MWAKVQGGSLSTLIIAVTEVCPCRLKHPLSYKSSAEVTTAAYLIWSHLTQASELTFCQLCQCLDVRGHDDCTALQDSSLFSLKLYSIPFIHPLHSFPSSFMTLCMMPLEVRVHVSYSFCTPLTSIFHFSPVEEAMSAKKKALSVCDLHMVPHQTLRTGIFWKYSVDWCIVW